VLPCTFAGKPISAQMVRGGVQMPHFRCHQHDSENRNGVILSTILGPESAMKTCLQALQLGGTSRALGGEHVENGHLRNKNKRLPKSPGLSTVITIQRELTRKKSQQTDGKGLVIS
jgi:hypothetical protein